MNLEEKTLSKKYIYNGRIINMRVDEAELPNGKKASREMVEHPGGVTVAALTAENELLFVRQFRYPYSEVVLELPAGKRDPGEEPFVTGKRELREETGAVAKTYCDLGKFYPTPGYTNEVIYLYGAKDLTFTSLDLDEDEFLNVERIPLDKAVEMVLNNEIPDGKTQTAILKINELIRRGKF